MDDIPGLINTYTKMRNWQDQNKPRHLQKMEHCHFFLLDFDFIKTSFDKIFFKKKVQKILEIFMINSRVPIPKCLMIYSINYIYL